MTELQLEGMRQSDDMGVRGTDESMCLHVQECRLHHIRFLLLPCPLGYALILFCVITVSAAETPAAGQ